MPDLLVSAPGSDVDGLQNAGSAWLVAGPIVGAVALEDTRFWIIEGAPGSASLGGDVAALGDLDGDGRGDLGLATWYGVRLVFGADL